MIGKSKVSIINKLLPKIWKKYSRESEEDFWGNKKYWIDYVQEDNYIISFDEEVGIISQQRYCWREGYFFTVINKRNETLCLDETEIQLPSWYEYDWKEELHPYTKNGNYTPIFNDFVSKLEL